MPRVNLQGTMAGYAVRYCVLIPSRGRVDVLAKSLKKMPWLDTPDTVIGTENREIEQYLDAIRSAGFKKVNVIGYENPTGSVAVAREYLRQVAMRAAPAFDYFVVTDDNAIHRSEEGLHNLVRACAEWPTRCVMAGMHNTAPHFDRGKIQLKKTVNRLTSYPTVAAIFQCYPRGLYEPYAYPDNAFGLDDRHFYLWLLSQGHTEFRVCMDAPFTKSRYQGGGQGTLDERAWKCGKAIEQLAHDFPKFVGARGTLMLPWMHLIQTVQNGGSITGDRLVGGAMRKEETLQKTDTTKKILVRKRISPHTDRKGR